MTRSRIRFRANVCKVNQNSLELPGTVGHFSVKLIIIINIRNASSKEEICNADRKPFQSFGKDPDPKLKAKMKEICDRSEHSSVFICNSKPKNERARKAHNKIRNALKKLKKTKNSKKKMGKKKRLKNKKLRRKGLRKKKKLKAKRNYKKIRNTWRYRFKKKSKKTKSSVYH